MSIERNSKSQQSTTINQLYINDPNITIEFQEKLEILKLY